MKSLKYLLLFLPILFAPNLNAQDNFSVRNGDVILPGTLLTDGNPEIPIVVFVHGSGPNDRDETIGPNKMFKQLAEKLASHGISSLRYDKRTLLYKHGADTITYKEETVDDAVAAARQLFAEGYKHIFVAGHSLGGHCIPLIAEACGDVLDGVIVMSGNVGTLESALNTQINYLGKQQGMTPAQIQATISQMTAALPQKYIEFDRSYSPLPRPTTSAPRSTTSCAPSRKWPHRRTTSKREKLTRRSSRAWRIS